MLRYSGHCKIEKLINKTYIKTYIFFKSLFLGNPWKSYYGRIKNFRYMYIMLNVSYYQSYSEISYQWGFMHIFVALLINCLMLYHQSLVLCLTVGIHPYNWILLGITFFLVLGDPESPTKICYPVPGALRAPWKDSVANLIVLETVAESCSYPFSPS